MQTQLSPAHQNTADGAAAEAILRKCVHCGFCTATCPTYQLLGDERDGPRGRIYLIKQVLEGATPTRATQQHLDRCLTCRNCETTCPSGVQYGALVEIGRRLVDAQVARPASERALRWALKEGLTSPLFKPAMALGRLARPLLPGALKDKVPATVGGAAPAAPWPQRRHARRVLLHTGCVQPAMAPGINAATARVLDAAGIQCLTAPGAGCCGAIRAHLNDHSGGLADARRNIDAWWPLLQPDAPGGAAEAIVSNASGCGLQLKDYGHALASDAAYADKAAQISRLTRDLSELLPDLVAALRRRLSPAPRAVPAADATADVATDVTAAPPCYVFHPPCTLQHGQKLRGGVESHLRALGLDVRLPAAESHLCCGSAGTYSVLQPALSQQLRTRKLQQLHAAVAAPPEGLAAASAGEAAAAAGVPRPTAILSANIGCITHLQAGTPVPVLHWVELLDRQLAAQAG